MAKLSALDREKLRRLRHMLALFFFALMLPVGTLLYFAFQQMKWEVYHQHRQQAEAFVKRVNNDLLLLIETENGRVAADYSFATPPDKDRFSGEGSPLSRLPHTLNIPGLVGHFQIGPEGQFSSPLLPDDAYQHSRTLMTPAERAQRLSISQQLRRILTPDVTIDRAAAAKPKASGQVPPGAADASIALEPSYDLSAAVDSKSGAPDMPAVKKSTQNLARFDANANKTYQQNRQRLGSVAELALDDRLEQKSKRADIAERAQAARKAPAAPQSIQRKESVGLPTASGAATSDLADFDYGDQTPASSATDYSFADERLEEASAATTLSPETQGIVLPIPSITSFESEVESLRLSVFDETHLVLHRNVWQNGSRLVQGAILDRKIFIDHFIRDSYLETSLAEMSRLVVAFNDDVLNIFSLPDKYRYVSNSKNLTGSVLYQASLPAPLQGFRLIFNIVELPLGASVEFLGIVTLVMLGVLLLGFYFIFRYGAKQIALVRQQQDFVSAVSHELKTPLTSIRMYSEMLKNGWADDTKKPGYYDYIHAESERLSRLIENVLQLARINRKQMKHSNDWINVDELLTNTLSSISSLTETNEFKVNQQFSPAVSGSKIFANADSAIQILINLVDNAVKFSRQSNRKEIDFQTTLLSNGSLEISIRDYGPGIDEPQMKKIFELFYRSENELTRETVGTGIGLNLVHELALSMGATVDVRNREPGAEFSIRWPAKLVKQAN